MTAGATLVRPDGYGRWHEHDTQVDFLLEYDRRTEPLDRLAARLARCQPDLHTRPVLAALLGREASLREALAGDARWAAEPFLVATASPALALGPTEAAWRRLDQTWPRRRLVELDDGER
jgi:hypothetical protein